MNIVEKLDNIFAPLDILVVKKTYEYLSVADKPVDVPVDELYEDAKKYLHCGEYPDRNLTWWYVFRGNKVDPNGEDWKNGILNFFRLTCTPKITELDNINNHISLDVEFKMIVVNSRKLPIEAFEGVKCATVITSLGEFPLITSEKDTTD